MTTIRRTFLALTAVVIACSGTAALAGSSHEHAIKPPKDFEKLKRLVGSWEGRNKMGDKEEVVTASYELTSAGSAILERLFAGTPHEMVSVYHGEKKAVVMTHYCALGNQPKLKLVKADDTMLAFDKFGVAGIGSPKEEHMHKLTITMTGPDQMRQEWVSYKNGKKGEVAVFNFERKK